MLSQEKPSIDEIRSLFNYDPSTGEITWLVKRSARGGCVLPGSPAGCLNGQGYRVIGIGGQLINAHQIAWAMFYGVWADVEIDHRNCEKADNRIDNLRLSGPSTNHANVRVTKANTSGRKGVCWNKRSQKWQAGIKVNGKSTHLGLFDDIDLAHAAYVKAANENFKEFARTA